ncbi:plasmid pRiA4b ORF-3 family protein [Lentibacillus sp. Marseille-P4043]|uniref:plasmid pRiA4b ORF-3 family protein n=1 Tax=Lentibacillus sp. Marseille-P4043 TaxID=2040293 RepID=UPI000D0BBCB3|nr:plasmid pRiA4b ORF-3 family protein [Lentibacillus sp. Marseille-P4043]
MILELKVTLRDVGMPVWRKLQVDSGITFEELHDVLQEAFDWSDMHLHSYFVRKTNGKKTDAIEIAQETEIDLDTPVMQETYQENEEILADWLKKVNDKVMYLYDFGDNWMHEIVLMKKITAEKDTTYPRCVSARNVAPPEDSRMEVIMEEIDLTVTDSKQLVKQINEDLHIASAEEPMENLPEDKEQEFDLWEDLLLHAKEFHKMKPWNYMDDNQIFAVVDPVSKERLFCSVLGAGDETFGLAIYVGKAGYTALLDIMEGAVDDFDIVLKQRSLLVTFEDREDLEKDDYQLIKTYDIPFRGRKTWPEFRSFKPGFVPWYIDDEEARMMNVVLGQAIEVCNEIKAGLEIPDVYEDEQVLTKVPKKADDDNYVFDTQILSLEWYEDNEAEETQLSISEFDLKRIQKFSKVMPITVEFSMQYLSMPVQDEDSGRGVFPLFVVAADHDQGLVFYQNLLTNGSDIGALQRELINMLSVVKGVPENILMDRETAITMLPLIERTQLSVEVAVDLPVVEEVLEGLEDYLE